jgi:RNA polymerase sigma-70 factor, ECF subfamily
MMSGTKPTRYSALSLKDLVCLCADGCDDAAWAEFVFRVGTPISLTAMRTASRCREWSPSIVEVEDLVQETYRKLCKDGWKLLRNFAVQHPGAILGYLRKTAANATIDYLKHFRSLKFGGQQPHVSTTDVDPEARKEVRGSQEGIGFGVLLKEIDGYLKRGLTGPDRERDRMIFWLYFRQGMSTEEIASLPTVGLGAKGVGSVIERLTRCIRQEIIGSVPGSEDVEQKGKSL